MRDPEHCGLFPSNRKVTCQRLFQVRRPARRRLSGVIALSASALSWLARHQIDAPV
jgi:hypothetical protein